TRAAQAPQRTVFETLGRGPENPHPPHLLPLLPLGCERRGEETTTEHRQEPAALRVLRDAAGEAGGLHRGAIVADNPEVYEAMPPKSRREKRLAASGSGVLFNDTDSKGGPHGYEPDRLAQAQSLQRRGGGRGCGPPAGPERSRTVHGLRVRRSRG